MNHPPRIAPRDDDLALLATLGPTGPQGWELAQRRLVAKPDFLPCRFSGAYLLDERPFFAS
jgi:hypothetical protein